MTRHVDSVNLKKQIWKDIRKNYPNGKKPPVINVCKYCEKTFSHHILMQKHIYDNHKEMIKYYCEKCPRSWVGRGNFFKHMNTMHESDSYECKFCMNSFTLLWDIVIEKASLNPITYKCYKNKKCPSCENENFE